MPELGAGTLFANRFEIDRLAGSGGMGVVYRARDRASGEHVALKLLQIGVGGPDDAARFTREARLLAELRHPGIVGYVDHGQTPEGQRFLAMEWLEGEDLSGRLARGRLPLADCVALVDRIADALACAHGSGVVHRDLKPSNVFLVGAEIGRATLLDFGIARRLSASHVLTATGRVIGTPEYMAPEQARGARDLTPAADLFALGCIFYECLTGHSPFAADHLAAVLVRILFEAPASLAERRPGLPAPLVRLVERLLAKEPAQRLPDAEALRAELAALGELREPILGDTLATRQVHAFALREQNLCSVVLAAPRRGEATDDHSRGATLLPQELAAADDERDALLRTLHGLGVSADVLGDGALVVVAPPTESATDQATRAARAALLIKERWPTATVAMATGRGALDGRTAVGEVVERAANTLQRADLRLVDTGPGVLLDALSADLLAGRFSQTPRPDGALLLAEERAVDTGRPLLGRPTPCVGREPELAALEAQLAGVEDDSQARAVLFMAPPGVGKSRLRHEFVRRVAQRGRPVTLLFGRGDPMRSGGPHGLLVDALRRLCDLEGSGPLAEQQQRLRARIGAHVPAGERERVVLFLGEMCGVPFPDDGAAMLRAARQEPKLMRGCLSRAFLDWLAAECEAAPVVLVLDDLQWSDGATVAAVDEALRDLQEAPLLVLAFARPEVDEAFPRLWQARALQRVPLKALSKRACERLIQHALGPGVAAEVIARAVERSAGNALYLEELIRSIAAGKSDEQPSTVLAMLQARIGALAAGARRAVRAAAVFGERFWRGGVGVVLGLPGGSDELAGWLSALVDAELVQPTTTSRLADEQEFAFRHALVRDAAYGLLTAEDLTTGHRLAAGFLEAAGEHDAVVAEHWELGGDPERAAASYVRAAEGCIDRGDHAGALRHVAHGLACAPDGELRGQLCSVSSYAAFWLDRHEGLAETAEEAMARLRPGSRGYCRAILPAILAAMGRADEARVGELVARLLATEPDEDARAADVEAVATVTSSLLGAAAPASLLAALLHRLEASVRLAEPAHPASRRYLQDVRGGLAFFRQPRPWTMLAAWGAGAVLCREAGDSRLELSLLGSREWGWLELGDAEGARDRLRALAPAMATSQDVVTTALWRNRLARVLCEFPAASAWAEAEELVAPMLAHTGGIMHFRVLAQGIVARVSLLRGQPGDAEAHARAAMAVFSDMPLWLLHTASVHVRALLALDRADEAVAVAERVLGVLPGLCAPTTSPTPRGGTATCPAIRTASAPARSPTRGACPEHPADAPPRSALASLAGPRRAPLRPRRRGGPAGA
ncbi:protein kinase [Nannocystis sp. ILAH1]|uniref:serine/threonine-protein kinase n=1 Tax=Nannocystis sp. ILAH1 TaxID=2996789 RepID=UPI00226E6976|nr:serine/threonine-protein kinase [Nannocystis sp. ILAH1]MCY0995476.1 protein kinase [Nannocystis sp. ILAH1]